jgi:UDP-N-acetylglucosamine--N-acetylmuramyl-(pentapeptide) pyrophosphoryl-undecaprenol N-acetylglucosamine transferase
MRLLLTGGGTGGHVYPALVVLDWLRATHPGIDVRWAGGERGIECELIAKHGLPYHALPVGAVRGRSPIGVARGITATAAGIRAAVDLIDHFQPSAILATGGYVSAPAVIAGRLRGVPSVVYLPDVVPGWAVRVLSRFASAVATTTPAARRHLPGARVVVTGYPVRPGFIPRPAEPARRTFALDPDRFTLTVVGGSLGARTINEAIGADLYRLLDRGQLIHITGPTGYERAADQLDALPAGRRRFYHPAPFINGEMPEALAAADLIVSRAGASVLGEYPAIGRASLLIPGPFSSQVLNAEYLRNLGASELLPNERVADLADRVRALRDDPPRLAEMAGAASRLAKPQAVARIGKLVLEVAGER